MSKLVVYHHGSVPSKEVAEVIKKLGKVPCRNALHFEQSGAEKFDRVVVDQGPKTGLIKAAYEGKAKVEVIGEGEAPEPEKAEDKKPAPFDADKPRTAGRQPRAQGGTKAPEPEKAS